MSERTVIALGGNAIAPHGGTTAADQVAVVSRVMGPVAELVGGGAEVILTHGNGPQVGDLLVKEELARDVVPPLPLDWCVAQTQATIGYTIVTALEHELAARGLARLIVPVITRVLVDADDPAWSNPTKKAGPYLLASPDPREILDRGVIRLLLEGGVVVVAAGGGGIPMVWGGDGRLHGVEAVVDKDLASARLGATCDARRLVILTDVEGAAVGYGTPDQEWLGAIDAPTLRDLQAQGHFASGSMGPKVEAALRFVEATGGRASIGSLAQAGRVLAGEAGTRVAPR